MASESSLKPPGTEAWFATTHWSMVLSARNKSSPQSDQAMAALCRAYWHPLYAFLRRQGQTPHDAEDLVQGFFAQLLAKDFLSKADRDKGRFRTYLLTALKRYQANEWDRKHARKRGGFQAILSIDQTLAESRLVADPAHELGPEVIYERQWAVTLLERVMTRLRHDYEATGRAALFESLHGCLGRDGSGPSYAEMGERLGLTVPAVKMAVQRLRARYRAVLREEIAHTVSTPADIETEIRHLFSMFDP